MQLDYFAKKRTAVTYGARAAELPVCPGIRSHLSGAKQKQTRGYPQRIRESVKVSISDMPKYLLRAVMLHPTAGSYLL